MRYPDTASLILRLGFGLTMMFGHGFGKFTMLLSGNDIQFLPFLGLSPAISLGLAVFAEFFAAFFVIIGYKTKWACVPLIVTMLVAAFMVHGGDPLFMKDADGGSKEPALLFLFGFFAIYFLDSGRFSVDEKLKGRIL